MNELESSLLPLGEGGAHAPDEGNPPHDFVEWQNRGPGFPHPALCATLSQWERARAKNRFRFSSGIRVT